MPEPLALPLHRLLLPTMWATIVVASAPFMSLLRRGLFTLFPERGVVILGVALALLLFAALVGALARIRNRRTLRYAGLGLVLLALWAQSTKLSTSLPQGIRLQVALTERVHIIEYGVLACLLVRALRPQGLLGAACLATVWATIAGVLDESVQLVAPSRTGEVRDIAINAAAAVTGALFALCVAPDEWWQRARAGTRSWSCTVTRSLAVLSLATGLFVFFAHLGYRIDDPEVGRFLSWHRPQRLRTLATNRAARWDGPNPPTGEEICCVQDYYLTEASRHNEHRNERYAAGDLIAAWHVDRLLHAYFEPYLDKPLPPDGRRPRDEVDHALLAQATRDRPVGTYSSPVLRGRVWTRPSKPEWLTATLLLSACLWLAPTLLSRLRSRRRKDLR